MKSAALRRNSTAEQPMRTWFFSNNSTSSSLRIPTAVCTWILIACLCVPCALAVYRLRTSPWRQKQVLHNYHTHTGDIPTITGGILFLPLSFCECAVLISYCSQRKVPCFVVCMSHFVRNTVTYGNGQLTHIYPINFNLKFCQHSRI